ncbi:hypothetical protein GCM10009529_05230 [Micropruina glycogenica]
MIALLLLTVVIVSTLVTRLFGDDFPSYGAELATIAWWWNAGDVRRMVLTAATLISASSACRELDRADNAGAPSTSS